MPKNAGHQAYPFRVDPRSPCDSSDEDDALDELGISDELFDAVKGTPREQHSTSAKRRKGTKGGKGASADDDDSSKSARHRVLQKLSGMVKQPATDPVTGLRSPCFMVPEPQEWLQPPSPEDAAINAHFHALAPPPGAALSEQMQAAYHSLLGDSGQIIDVLLRDEKAEYALARTQMQAVARAIGPCFGNVEPDDQSDQAQFAVLYYLQQMLERAIRDFKDKRQIGCDQPTCSKIAREAIEAIKHLPSAGYDVLETLPAPLRASPDDVGAVEHVLMSLPKVAAAEHDQWLRLLVATREWISLRLGVVRARVMERLSKRGQTIRNLFTATAQERKTLMSELYRSQKMRRECGRQILKLIKAKSALSPKK